MALWLFTVLSCPKAVLNQSGEEPNGEEIVARRSLGDSCPVLEAFSLCSDGVDELEDLASEIIGFLPSEPEEIPVVSALKKSALCAGELVTFTEAVKALYAEDLKIRKRVADLLHVT